MLTSTARPFLMRATAVVAALTMAMIGLAALAPADAHVASGHAAPAAWSGWSEVPGAGATRDAPRRSTTGATSTCSCAVPTTGSISTGSPTGVGRAGRRSPARGSRCPLRRRCRSTMRCVCTCVVRTTASTSTSCPTGPGRAGRRFLVPGRLVVLPRRSTTGAASTCSCAVPTTASTSTSSSNGTWSGWSEVPGAGLTLSASAAVSFDDALRLYVRGTDDRIYVNKLSNGTWSGWSEVPGAGATGDAPRRSTTGAASTCSCAVPTTGSISTDSRTGVGRAGRGPRRGAHVVRSGGGVLPPCAAAVCARGRRSHLRQQAVAVDRPDLRVQRTGVNPRWPDQQPVSDLSATALGPGEESRRGFSAAWQCLSLHEPMLHREQGHGRRRSSG